MKLKSENPAYGLSISYEGNRYTCEKGETIDVPNTTARGILKTMRGVVEDVDIIVPEHAAATTKKKKPAKKSAEQE